MPEEQYQFRNEITGEVIEVDFETMMNQGAGGFLELEVDGQKVTFKRVHDDERSPSGKPIILAAPPKIISGLALGVFDTQVDDYREDAKKHGFTDIEFVPEKDFQETGFYEAHCTCPEQWARYVKHRGLPEGNGQTGSAVAISGEQIEQARQQILRNYGPPRKPVLPKK